jgi:glycosyltransferase involved in cell wall biosynthesis
MEGSYIRARHRVICSLGGMMRILLVSNIPNVHTLAVNIINRNLGAELSKLGHMVDYAMGDILPRPLQGSRLAPVLFALALPLKLAQLQRRRGRYDVVSISGGDGAGLGLLRRSMHSSGPHVYCAVTRGLEHGLWDAFCAENKIGRAYISLQHRLYFGKLILKKVEISIRTSDHLVCDSGEDGNYVSARGWLPAERISHIANGVEDKFFAKDGSRCGLLFVGRWDWRKGIYYLVRAFEQIARVFPGTRLSLLGTRFPADVVLKDFPAHLHASVRVVSELGRDELVGEYRSHQVFLFPTLYEGTPGVMLEAMAAGCPVVTTRACGMQQVIEHGTNGLLVPPRDIDGAASAAIALLQDQSLAGRLAARAQETARGYRWPEIAAQTDRLYRRLLG